MANLLDLVDQLIGNVLVGNIYTNVSQYSDAALARTPQSPTPNPPIPSSDPRLLNFEPANPHPHGSLVGTNPSVNVIPEPVHDNRPDFLDPAPLVGPVAASTSAAKRAAIYQPNTPPPDVGGQLATIPPTIDTSFTTPSKLDLMSRKDLASKFDENRVGRNANLNPQTLLNPGESTAQDHGLLDGNYRGGNQYDDKGINFFSKGGTYSVPSYGLLRTLDIAVMAHWLRNVSRQVYFIPSTVNDPITGKLDSGTQTETIVKSATWLASQFLLASFNKGDSNAHGISNMIWNPLSFVAAMLPGTRGLGIDGIHPTGITAHATGLFGTYKSNVQDAALAGLDRLQLIRKGAYSEVAPVHRLSQIRSPVATPGYSGDLTKTGEGDTLQQEQLPIPGRTVSAQVDGGQLTILAAKLGLHTNLYNSENPYGATNAVKPLRDLETSLDPHGDKLKALFDPKGFPGGATTAFGPLAYNFVSKVNPLLDYVSPTDFADAPGINAAVTDAAFAGEDPNTALFATNPIPEDQIYMPFMFQDLRDSAAGQAEQFLYFRAFLKDDLTETFTPDWQTERYYGRVDEIPTYLGTSRNVNVSFDVVAWSLKDLNVIWTKLQKLQSMVYPTYNQAGFMSSGPIIRMRIGDLFAGLNNRGLPGYITSLDFAYDDGIWNIQQDFKVPRKISVSLSYVVLHDGNPGIYPYASADLAPDGSIVASGGPTFGAGKFTRNSDGTFTATVSVRDIRKIFGSVRNIAT